LELKVPCLSSGSPPDAKPPCRKGHHASKPTEGGTVQRHRTVSLEVLRTRRADMERSLTGIAPSRFVQHTPAYIFRGFVLVHFHTLIMSVSFSYLHPATTIYLRTTTNHRPKSQKSAATCNMPNKCCRPQSPQAPKDEKGLSPWRRQVSKNRNRISRKC
jgi:hypothetical protein